FILLIDKYYPEVRIYKDDEIYVLGSSLNAVNSSKQKKDLFSTLGNVIYYGSPGTGKSHRADIETSGKEVQKVTFHPDYDYHSFVGGYKPTMAGDKIAYKFVP